MAIFIKNDGKWVGYGSKDEDKDAEKDRCVTEQNAVVEFIEVDNGGARFIENDGQWYEISIGS